MSFTLLKPYVLSYKNRLLFNRQGVFNREALALILTFGLVSVIYAVNVVFLKTLISHPSYQPAILENLLKLFLFGFFALLTFSNLIVALSSLFLSQDISLLLVAPVSLPRLYFAKLLEITFTSSWIFFLFALPVCFAYSTVLNPPMSFLLVAFILLIPFTLIPAALGMVFVTLFINVIPPYRMRDLLVVVALISSGLLLYFGHNSPEYLPSEDQKLNELVVFLDRFRDPQPVWLPSRWIGDILGSYFVPAKQSLSLAIALLIASLSGVLGLSYLTFDLMFRRGLSVSAQSKRGAKIYSSSFLSFLGRVAIPFNQSFRAMAYKEARMFIRDTTQALQLMMLLLLTFMYLYNFRALRAASTFTESGAVWWQVVLAVANIIFGSCVVSAIATRFVFPSISLEGRGFFLLRSTPLSIEQFLRYKFFTWFGPILFLALILLVSGIMAIQGSFSTIIATAAVAAALTIGITGLGVGAGAYYARFDWESPAQVTASFGSLVYMLLSLTNILISTVPIMFLFILTGIPGFAAAMSSFQYYACVVGSLILLLSLNIFAARHALQAGANALRERD